MTDSEESKRVSVQIASLSTQLIESIDKQSELEEKLNQAKRTIQNQTNAVNRVTQFEAEIKELNLQLKEKNDTIKGLNQIVQDEKALRLKAEDSIDELNKEIEDLTASLFDEANNMVATARKESHATEIKSHKLMEQLKEKDCILETLNLQLKNLKKVLQNIEQENPVQTSNKRGSVITNDNATSSSVSLRKSTTNNSNRYSENLYEPIYTPNMSSIRYDLALYHEFMKFIAVLPHCDSIRDSASESKLLKRIVTDEVQPILRLDNASGLGWIVRRTLMSQMIDGLVALEPLSGINETYQFGHGSPQPRCNENVSNNDRLVKDSHLFNFPSDSPPVAVHEKCSFCGESRRDIIEHARMHVLKTMTRMEDGSLVPTNSFPLCNYCLLKLRQTCEIFAFLRSLKIGAWNLEKISLKSISRPDTNKSFILSKGRHVIKNDAGDIHENASSDLQRNDSSVLATTTSKPTCQEAPQETQIGPNTNIQRAWIQLCKLRSTLHWTHIGIWSVNDAISSKIGPIIPEGNQSENSSLKADETYELKNHSVESFTLKKENDDETESEDIICTFDNTGLEDAKRKITKESQNRASNSRDASEIDSLTELQNECLSSESLSDGIASSATKSGTLTIQRPTAPIKPEASDVNESNLRKDSLSSNNGVGVNGRQSKLKETIVKNNESTFKGSTTNDTNSSFSNNSNKDDEFDDAQEEQFASN